MSVVKDIAEWAKQLPPWHSDAIRRIFTQDELLAEDEDEVLAMLLAAHGIVDKDQPAAKPIPFLETGTGTTAAQSQVVLNELHSVVGVNALVPDQSLAFALDGLTIIYGDNGAGKSGYSRVLKHSCHAREKSEPIQPNVAEKSPPAPSAIIELTVDGEQVAINWAKDMVQSVHLLEIAVFDSHCARVFLDNANEVVYLPSGSELFPKLAALMNRLKEKLRVRIAAIPARLAVVDEFNNATAAGAFVHSIIATSDPARVDALARLDEKEKARLAQLRTIVATAKVNPPKGQAAQLRRRKTRIEQVKQKIAALEAAFSENSVKKLRQLREAADAAAKASELASIDVFKSEPVEKTGSEAWRILFQAAKQFSVADAFPGEQFPYVGEGAVCVLCQQTLTEDAKARLTRFEKFVSDDTAKRKAAADAACKEALTTISGSDVQLLERDTTYIDDLRAASEELATKVEAFFKAGQSRKEAIGRACETNNWEGIPAIGESLVEALAQQISSLEQSAVDFDKADNPDELKKIEAELSELEDRDRTLKYALDIKAFIADKLKESILRDCERAVDTTAITRFSSDLISKTVTDQLENCLAAELVYFSAHDLPLELKKSGERGKTKHQLIITSDVRPSLVLSEGEQRVVAIACFLAELKAVGHTSPIIFDDPVSSLDHVYRQKVAVRLVIEAKRRQVVVFTHDITLLLALERECADRQVPLLLHTVRRTATGPGECAGAGAKPWHAQSTKDRIGHLRQASAGFKKLQAANSDDFEKEAKNWYGLLRECWERAIEEVVLNGVIGRFDPAIQTKRLRGVCMEAADYAIIEREMSKCSTRFTGHDTAPALSLGPMKPEEIETDLHTLDTFVKEMKERQKKAEKEADELVRPPAAKVAAQRAAKAGGNEEKLIA